MASEMDFSILQHRCSDECLRLLITHLPFICVFSFLYKITTQVFRQDVDLFAGFIGLIIMWFTGRLLFKMYSKLRTSWFPWLLRCCTFWSKENTTEVSVTRKDAEQDGKLIQEIPAAAETEKPETTKLSSVPNEGELDRRTTEKVIMSANLNPDVTEKTDVLTENEADLRASLKFICKVCVVKCYGEANFIAHLVGKKHHRKIFEMFKTAEGNYLCSYCDVDCKNWSNFGSHLKGKKHLSNIYEVFSARDWERG